jgi:F-box associated protein
MKRTSPNSNTVFLQNLPYDVLVTLHSFLTYADITQCKLVCQLWHSIIFNESEFLIPLYRDRFSWINPNPENYRDAYKGYAQLLEGASRSMIICYPKATIEAIAIYKQQFIAGFETGTICFHDIATGQLTETFKDVDAPIEAMTVHQNYLVACEDDHLHSWNIDTKAYLDCITTGPAVACLDSDGHRLISGDIGDQSDDVAEEPCTSRLWDLETPTATTIYEYKAGVTKLKLDQDNVVIGFMDKSLALVDLVQPKAPLFISNAHKSPIHSFVIDGKLIISCADEGVKVWDRQTLAAQKDHPLEVAFRVAHMSNKEEFGSLTLWDKILISTSRIAEKSYAKLWNFEGAYRLIPQLSPFGWLPVLSDQGRLISAPDKDKIQILNGPRE